MNTTEIILRRLDEMFPDKALLSKKDVSQYTGLSYPTIAKKFGLVGHGMIDKVLFAQKLSEGVQ